jgi:hypothetical protein
LGTIGTEFGAKEVRGRNVRRRNLVRAIRLVGGTTERKVPLSPARSVDQQVRKHLAQKLGREGARDQA